MLSGWGGRVRTLAAVPKSQLSLPLDDTPITMLIENALLLA